MIRTMFLLVCMFVGAACARPAGRTTAEAVVTDSLRETPARSETWTTADLHRLVPRQSGVLLILDSTVAVLDTTAWSRAHRDSLLARMAGRVITRIEMYPAGDTAMLRWLGSRAQHGVVLIETRPF